MQQQFFVMLAEPAGALCETDYSKVDPVYGEAPRCQACGKFTGMRRWLPPYRVGITLYGAQWGDFAFQTGGNPLASERAIEAALEAKVRGLTVLEPVEVVRANGSSASPPLYYRIEAQRAAATLDESQSAVLRSPSPSCPVCGQPGPTAIRGFEIDSSTWDGADFFTLRGQGELLVVTARFAEVSYAHRLTNVSFIPVDRYESGMWEGQAPLARHPNAIS